MSDTNESRGTNESPGRKVIAHIAMSIDGAVADSDGGMGWIGEHAVHPETAAYFEGIWRGASTALLGRVNYEGFAGFWPPVAKDPNIGWFPADSAPRHHDMAVWLDTVEKVVFSRTLKTADWQNARIAERELEDEVRALKAGPGRDIIVLSSVSIIRALMGADLVDELRFTVIPTVLGGPQLFDNDVPVSKWQLAGVKTFPSGGVGLHYTR